MNEESREDMGDEMLALFIRGLNVTAGDSSIGVTLWVGGSIVSGELVGRSIYFAGLAEMMQNEADAPTFAELFGEFAAQASQVDTETADMDNTGLPIGYIHLRNARTYTAGSPIPANRGVWWRGRLDSVDAWSFGLLSAVL